MPSERLTSSTPTTPTDSTAAQESEAYRVLCGMAHGKLGTLPAPAIVQHLLSVTRGADWPVQRAALEAILRRWSFARRDGLRVAARPGRGAIGTYVTRGADGSRPYSTLLTSLDPPAGSCDCPDYLRSSLGLCKHLLVVLESLAPRKGRPPRVGQTRPALPATGPHLGWDPVRPLTGAGDWLERLRWVAGLPQRGRPSQAAAQARLWFSADGDRVIDARLVDPERRERAVRDLWAFAASAAGKDGAQRAEPAVRALLEAERTRLQRRRELQVAADKLPAELRSLCRRLYPYQVEGVRAFLASGRLLLADDMGLGKTAQAVACAHVLWRTGRVRRGLLLVPASLKEQWLREWQLFSDAPASLVEGGPEARAAVYDGCRRGFLIANYEQLLRDLPAVERFAPELVVLDEAQRIKNWATKTAAHVKRLTPPYRLVLTGTPMENRIDELASLMDWVDDLALEPKWRIGPWHSITVDGRHELGGARHLDTLRARLSGRMVRRLREQILDQLPPRTDTRVPVELTAEQQQEHDALVPPIARIIAGARRRPLTQAEFLRLMSLLTTQRIICNGLAQLRFEEMWPTLAGAARPSESLLRGLFSPKLIELRELLGTIAVTQRRKVVVFSQWRRMLRLASWAVSDLLAQAGARALFFTGEEGLRRRTQNLVAFHDDPAARVLFATDAGGVGLNLQHAASCCINLELPWNPAVLEQRVGRIYRLGQREPVEAYHLVSEGGIEARIVELVGNKRAIFRGLFDGTSDEVRFETSGSFLSRIEQLLDPAILAARAASGTAAGAGGVDATDAADAAEAAELEESRVEEAGVEDPALADTLAAAGSVAGGAADGEATSAPPLHAAPGVGIDLGALLGGLTIRPRADGGITLEAPPQTAAIVAQLLQSLAEQLRSAAPPIA